MIDLHSSVESDDESGKKRKNDKVYQLDAHFHFKRKIFVDVFAAWVVHF